MSAAPLLLACLFAPPAPGLPAAVALERALDAPLAAPVRFERRTPLANALAALLPGVPIESDTPRLDAVAVDFDELTLPFVVELPAGRFPVRTAVEEALAGSDFVPLKSVEVSLTYFNDDGVLRVTTPRAAERALFTRVYPVRDLLEAAGPFEASRLFSWPSGEFVPALPPEAYCFSPSTPPGLPDPQREPTTPFEYAVAARGPLVRLIQHVTGGVKQGGGWRADDGEGGSITDFDGLLVVRQTDAVHRQIAALLAGLRAANETSPWSAPPGRPSPNAPKPTE